MSGQISNAGEAAALALLFPTTGTYAMLLAPTNGAWVIDDTTTLATAATYEVTDTAYARKPIAWTAPTLGAVGAGSIVKNSVDINWAAWALDQPTTKKIAMMAIVDAASGTTGKVLAYFILAAGSELAPTATQPVKILANQLTISLN